MPDQLKAKLQDYVVECKQLQDGFEDLIDDIRHISRGGEIKYAVDFAEISSYVLPRPKLSKYFTVFSSEMTDSENAALERSILRYIFYGPYAQTRPRLILLPPYAHEMSVWMDKIAQSDFDTIIRASLKAFEEEARILENSDFSELLRLSSAEANVEFSPDDLMELETIIEEYAPSIGYLLSPPSDQPFREIKKLLTSGIFTELGETVTYNFEFDNPIADWWHQRLIDRRGQAAQASSRMDAVAISMVVYANRTLEAKGEKTRIRLVTRSSNMRKIYRDLQNTDADKDSDNDSVTHIGNILRHPRMFRILSLIDSFPLDQQEQELIRRLELVKVFLKAANASRPLHEFPEEETRISLEDTITTIRSDWISADRVLSGRHEVSTVAPDQYDYSVPERVRELRYVITTRGGLRTLILDKLIQLYVHFDGNVRRGQEWLGFVAQSTNHEGQDLIRASIDVDIFDDKYVLRTNSHSVPCTLQFFSPGARDLLVIFKEMAEARESTAISWFYVLELFKIAFAESADYERLLVMAYLLAIINKWDLAEIYCERARFIIDFGGVSHHEGEYFYAVCMRKHNRTPARHRLAIKAIDHAIELKRRYLHDSNYDDPRYLTEKATHILICHIYYPKNRFKDIPSADYGLSLLEQSLQLCRDDAELRLRIYNNLLDFRMERCIQENRIVDLEQLKQSFCNLETQLNLQKASNVTIKPTMRDTYALAKWLLFDSGIYDKTEILHELEEASASPILTNQEKGRIEKHRLLVLNGKKLRIET